MKRGEPLRRSSPEQLQAWRRRSKQLTSGRTKAKTPRRWRDRIQTEVLARSGGWCEANTAACPVGRHIGEQFHHRRLRSQGGKDTAENLVFICAAAHDWVHKNPAEAHERGLILWAGDL
jgi:hypothetical protein